MSYSARLFTTNTLQQPIQKAAHGFTVGQILRFDGVNYVLAQANAAGTSSIIGMVASVVDVNNFILSQAGYITGIPGGVGLVAGTVYYLSPSVAGNLTSTFPVTNGQFVEQLFIANTTTSGYFLAEPPVPALSAGSLFIGATTGTPVAAQLTAGAGISITPASGAITIAATGSGTGIAWVDQTTGSVTLAANTAYVTDNGASLVTYTLPATASIGAMFGVVGKSSGGWKIIENAGQTMILGALTTTVTTGSLASSQTNNVIWLVCTTANTVFTAYGSIGNITVI